MSWQERAEHLQIRLEAISQEQERRRAEDEKAKAQYSLEVREILRAHKECCDSIGRFRARMKAAGNPGRAPYHAKRSFMDFLTGSDLCWRIHSQAIEGYSLIVFNESWSLEVRCMNSNEGTYWDPILSDKRPEIQKNYYDPGPELQRLKTRGIATLVDATYNLLIVELLRRNVSLPRD